MKKLYTLSFAILLFFIAFGQTNSNDNYLIPQDSLKEVFTDGIFDGVYIAKMGYKINEYYIAQEDLTTAQVDSFKGKRVIVTGQLKIVKGNYTANIQSISEDRKYIAEPKITFYMYKEPEGFISH